MFYSCRPSANKALGEASQYREFKATDHEIVTLMTYVVNGIDIQAPLT